MYKSSTATVSARSADYTANSNSYIEYTVTLDKQSGSGGSSSVAATLGVSMPSITVPTRTGYTFNGYYSSTSGGTQYYNGSGASVNPWTTANNQTLYAQWTINQYTVTFNSNGGSVVSSVTQNYATTIASPVTTKAGYTLAGWYTNSGLTSAATFPYTASANATLYAKWTQNAYTVTYNANTADSGTVPSDASTYVEGQYFNVKANTGTLAKAHFTFAGWNTAANGLGTNYSQNQSVPMGTANLILYAKWTANATYTVSYNGNGSTSGKHLPMQPLMSKAVR